MRYMVCGGADVFLVGSWKLDVGVQWIPEKLSCFVLFWIQFWRIDG